MQRQSTQLAKQLIRNPDPTSGQGRANFHARRQALLDHTGKEQHLSAGIGQPLHLLPRGVADPAGSYFMRETIQHPDWSVIPCHVSLFLADGEKGIRKAWIDSGSVAFAMVTRPSSGTAVFVCRSSRARLCKIGAVKAEIAAKSINQLTLA